MSSHTLNARYFLTTSAQRVSQSQLQLQRRGVHHHTFRFRSLSLVISASTSTSPSTILKPTAYLSRPQTRHHSSTSRSATTTSIPQYQTSTMSSLSPPQNASSNPPNRTYEAALAHLSQLQSNKTITNLFANTPNQPATTDLNALAMPEMLAWLSRAGYTPSSLASSGLRCVHVAGTKGKGSVSTQIASILTQYATTSSRPDITSKIGDKVGLYTSPHVLTVRERIQLNGAPISPDKFATYFFELWDRLTEAARQAGDLLPASGSIQSHTSTTSPSPSPEEQAEDPYAGPATKPFYFRFLTLLAFHIFIREGVRSAVVECGIGGEYDPTNLLCPEMVTAGVITQLGVDHVSMLGDTVPKIAWHKAGILKRGVRGFTRSLAGEDGGEVMAVLRGRAEEKGVLLEVVGDEEVEGWWSELGLGEEAKLQGPFQRYNMALAAKAAREHLIKMRVDLGEGVFAKEGRLVGELPREFVTGLKKASLRGRCEVFRDSEAEWFVDGAHTEDSLRGVGQWFAGKVKKGGSGGVRVLLFNQQDRDPAVLLKALLSGAQDEYGTRDEPLFTHAIFTRNEENLPTEGEERRDLEVQEKAQDVFREFVGNSGKVESWTQNAVVPSIDLIRDLARKATEEGEDCKVLATGSFHLIGAVLKTIDHVEY